jgi:hypothetical protein
VRRLWLWLLALAGCGHPAFVDTNVQGVPNLMQVVPGSPRLWRMGQPADATAWGYVAKTLLGPPSAVRLGNAAQPRIIVFKLNDDAEGSDDLVTTFGWQLVKVPLPPEDDKVWTVLVKPDPKEVWRIVHLVADAYAQGYVVVWHCTAGRDRTSLVAALVGMKLFGWTKDVAWQDMLAHGFRWELPDLDAFWVENVQ